MSAENFELAVLQFAPVWEDPDASFAIVSNLVAQASLPAGSLLVLPETFATGFSSSPGVVEHPGGPTDRFLSDLARRHRIAVVAGLVRRGDDGAGRNIAVFVDSSGEEIGAYAKRRPFVPGGEPWVAGAAPGVVDWRGNRIALHVCFDLRFPELFRATLDPIAPVLHVVIASWPVARAHHWTHLLRARAIENQALVVGVNRVGADPFHAYDGRSVVFDPDGTPLLEAGGNVGVFQTSLDFGKVGSWRQRLPFLP